MMRKLTKRLLASGIIASMTGCFFGVSKTIDKQTMNNSKPKSSIYDVAIKKLDGTPLNLSEYKGKKLLIVNTASECGFTPQYEDLQKLNDAYQDKLTIIGTPCNQFGGQEPGDANTIQSFCTKNFGVTFTLTEKLDVKGENQHELYEWLTKKSINGVLDSEVKWNFNKYLISEEGMLIAYFASTTSPMSNDITKFLD